MTVSAQYRQTVLGATLHTHKLPTSVVKRVTDKSTARALAARKIS
jgi:hypothetical protein